MSIVSTCGRGLISVEDYVKSAALGLERYINDSDERLIKAARKISGGHNNETEVEYKIRKKNERKEQWREKSRTICMTDGRNIRE